jgi:ubiquinone/menaquinone biosynthesis C-methylase UbiE
LDIGTGDGKTALMIREISGIEVDMVDLYDDSLSEEVRERLREDPQFNHTVYDAGSALPFPAGCFGSASLFYVLHHCPTSDDAVQLLKESRRVLDSNGRLIVLEEVVENEEDNDYLLQMDLELSKVFYPALFSGDGDSYRPPRFFREYGGMSELTGLFEAAGFALIDSEKQHMQDTFPRTIYILG